MLKPAAATAQTGLEMVTLDQRNRSLSGARSQSPSCRDTTHHAQAGGMLDFERGITSEGERRRSRQAWYAEVARFAGK